MKGREHRRGRPVGSGRLLTRIVTKEREQGITTCVVECVDRRDPSAVTRWILCCDDEGRVLGPPREELRERVREHRAEVYRVRRRLAREAVKQLELFG